MISRKTNPDLSRILCPIKFVIDFSVKTMWLVKTSWKFRHFPFFMIHLYFLRICQKWKCPMNFMTPSLHQSVTKNQTTKIFVVVFVAIRENTAAPLFSLNCNNNKKANKDCFFFTSFSCFWSLTDVMMWTLVIFAHFCNSDENL